MPDYPKLFETAAGAIGLQDEIGLLRALGKLGRKWSELKPKIERFGDATALFNQLAGDVEDDSIKQAFGDVGLASEYAELKRLMKRVRELEGSIPDKYKKLLEPLSTYNQADSTDDGAVDWKLIDASQSFGREGDFTFSVSGNGTVALAAGDVLKVMGEEQRLLKIEVSAGVKAKGGGAAPFKALKAGGGFESTAEVGLAYHFQPVDSGSLYAIEVARRLPSLPDPFSFTGAWAAFASEDVGLRRMTYAFEGAAKANVDVSVAKSVSFGRDLAADLALTIGAAVSASSSYTLTLTAGDAIQAPDGRTTGRKIEAILKRKRLSDQALTLGLKVDMDVSALAKRVQKEVQKAVDEWNSVLKQVKPFLSPGTLIQTELSDLLASEAERLIADENLRTALVRDLRGVIGVDTSRTSALAEWLSGQLTGGVDAARGVLTGRADAAADRVIAQLAKRLPAFAQEDVKNRLKPALQRLVEGLDGKLEAAVKPLFERERERLGDALYDVGIHASDRVADLDKAVASVRDVIERFDNLIHDTVAKMGDASRMKISASMQAEERQESEEALEIAGTLTADSETARKVFRALTRGRPADLRQLLAADDPGDDFVLDPARSKLRRYSRRSSRIGYEVVIFGFAASGHIIASGQAAVEVTATGDVQVDSKANIENIFKAPRESREVKFVETFNLLRARIEGQDRDRKRALELGVSITHHDQSLKLGEMQDFLTSLSDRGLLPREVRDRATEHFSRWAGSNSAGATLKADIAAKLWLDASQAERLMATDRRNDEHRLRRNAAVQIVRTAARAMIETKALGRMSEERFNEAVGFVRDRMYRNSYPKDRGRSEILWDMVTPSEREGSDTPGELPEAWPERLPTGDEKFRADVKRLLGEKSGDSPSGIRGQLHDLVTMIDLMGQIYLAQPRGLQDSPLGWTEATYRDKQAQVARRGTGWLKTGGKLLFWIAREAQPWTVALLGTLADLARGSREGAMSLTITRFDGDEQAETVELAKAT